jgi:hypothetical protein
LPRCAVTARSINIAVMPIAIAHHFLETRRSLRHLLHQSFQGAEVRLRALDLRQYE